MFKNLLNCHIATICEIAMQIFLDSVHSELFPDKYVGVENGLNIRVDMKKCFKIFFPRNAKLC